MLSRKAVSYFDQFIYQSILNTAIEDREVTFTCQSSPFPVFYQDKKLLEAYSAVSFSVILGIALSLIPSVLVSTIIKERELQLKHMQMISGASLISYWVSNFIFDIAKTYIPMLCFLFFNEAFTYQRENFAEEFWLYLIFPLAIVPFTYITSFLFDSDNTAQIFTIFMHICTPQLEDF